MDDPPITLPGETNAERRARLLRDGVLRISPAYEAKKLLELGRQLRLEERNAVRIRELTNYKEMLESGQFFSPFAKAGYIGEGEDAKKRLQIVEDLRKKGWKEIERSLRVWQVEDGFEYRAFKNNKGDVILSFGGTNDAKDGVVDGLNTLGFTTGQYEGAIKVAKRLKGQVERTGGTLILTGHSLGGGLAETAGIVNRIPAVTFNAAGPSDDVLAKYGAKRDGQIASTAFYSFRIKGELLSNAQNIGVVEGFYLMGGAGAFLAGWKASNGVAAETTWLTPPRGKEVTPTFPTPPGLGILGEGGREILGAFGFVNSRLELHYMESVDLSLEQALRRVESEILRLKGAPPVDLSDIIRP
jgi:hypothetical protein